RIRHPPSRHHETRGGGRSWPGRPRRGRFGTLLGFQRTMRRRDMNVVQLRRPEQTAPAPTSTIALAVVVAEESDGHVRVRIGAVDEVAAVDPSADPALLREAAASGARVVVELSATTPGVLGTVVTARSLNI